MNGAVEVGVAFSDVPERVKDGADTVGGSKAMIDRRDEAVVPIVRVGDRAETDETVKDGKEEEKEGEDCVFASDEGVLKRKVEEGGLPFEIVASSEPSDSVVVGCCCCSEEIVVEESSLPGCVEVGGIVRVGVETKVSESSSFEGVGVDGVGAGVAFAEEVGVGSVSSEEGDVGGSDSSSEEVGGGVNEGEVEGAGVGDTKLGQPKSSIRKKV